MLDSIFLTVTMIVGSFISVSSTIIYGPQPRIVARDGHLIFHAAEHKNISFLTNGLGRIHINGVELTNVRPDLEMGELAKQYKSSIDVSLAKLSKLEQTFDEDLLQKLAMLKNGPINGTQSSLPFITTSTFKRSIRVLNRKLGAIHSQVNAIAGQLITNECNSDPCHNGGTCFDLYNGYMCKCSDQWEGSNCEKDVNECANFAGTDLGCQNGATCINSQGSYQCECRPGWFGTHCIRRSSDCNTASSYELCGHGICVNQNNDVGYKCICDQGWTTDSKTPACNTDIDECSMNKPPCSMEPHVQCINLPGAFHCGSCPVGFTGNGYYCRDIDECSSSETACSINPKVACINTHGSYVCGNCPPGYAGDGKTCSYQGLCNVNNGGCHSLAKCHEDSRIGSTYVRCSCPAGYLGNGIGPSGCRAPRSTTPKSIWNPCSSNPCVHGVCKVNGSSFTCDCRSGFGGPTCDVACECLNNGTCNSGSFMIWGRPVCKCPPGFQGSNCGMQKQECGGSSGGDSGEIKFPTDTQIVGKIGTFQCSWTISPRHERINITFNSINVGPQVNSSKVLIHCGGNYIRIGPVTFEVHQIKILCGQVAPKSIIIWGAMVNIRLVVEIPTLPSSFELTWKAVPEACGEEISVTSHGTIRSGNARSFLNRDCHWILKAPIGKRIVFHFFSLNLGGSKPNCNNEFVKFISGVVPSGEVFAEFCNNTMPAPLYSPGHEVLVYLHFSDTFHNQLVQMSYALTEGIPGCGGVYTSGRGEIRSPNLNGEYPPNLKCDYLIQLTGSLKTTLTFTQFNIEDSGSCKYDRVSIHNGASSNAPLIGRYCGSQIPAPYATESNNILIVFETDYATSGDGFVINYESVCWDKFTETNGNFQSPKSSSNPVSCSYQIAQPLGKSIVFNINLERKDELDCNSNYLEIRDGENERSPLVGKYCDKVPRDVVSSLNFAFVKFYSTNIRSFGFNASYHTIQTGSCGGVYKESPGTISSPKHPDVYSGNLACTWVLSADPGYIVKLTWLSFNLEGSSPCSYDYVQIFDNNTDSGEGTLLGRFCGDTLPPMALSTSNVMTIQFNTDETEHRDGFLAAYAFVEESDACGGHYYSSAGVIKSPGYPNNYGLNQECTWIITAPQGQQIMLNVTDFKVEMYRSCKYDFLEIRNGATITSPLLGTFCGVDIPKLIPSLTNQLFLRFKSDMTIVGKGFQIFWDSTTTGCGGHLTAPTGSIISPNYPEPYPNSAECIWKISVSAGSVIEILFADFSFEHQSELCNLDYIEILDGPFSNPKLLGHYCSKHPSHLISSTNHVTVKFRSDSSVAERGFQMHYSTVCNTTVKGLSGVIESPNFPNGYPSKANCSWKIVVPQGNKINISFTHMEMLAISRFQETSSETVDPCNFDFVKVYYLSSKDGYYEDTAANYEQVGNYCGPKLPPPITLNSHIGLIRFKSDIYIHGAGFRLEWQVFGCSEVFTHPSGTFSTPNYPKHYPSSVECIWKIQVEFGNIIQLTFTEMDIEKDSDCRFDGIHVHNGEDESYPELATLCYQNKPTVLSSTSNALWIKFNADSVYEGKGFLATYNSTPGKCGGKFTANKGSIMSANYPRNFEKNETCTYLIQVDEGHLINLKFDDFDLVLPPESNCSVNTTHLTIYDGPDSNSAILEILCGKQENKTYTSTSNSLFIVMISTDYDTSKGFLAKYSKACGAQIITSDSGTISLAQYEFKEIEYDSTEPANCSWTITSSDPSKHVSLTITHLSSPYSYCGGEHEPLRIFNGETSKAPLIGAYCAPKLPPMITSDGASLHITADHSLRLSASYSIFDSVCGGTLTSIEGEFTSPGFPKSYPMNTECEWNIPFPEGNRVSLFFHTFELLSSPNCDSDYLEIRQSNSGGKVLGRFCGDNMPTNITDEPSLWVFLKTSSVVGEGESIQLPIGFHAEYVLARAAELSGQNGVIVSPSLGAHYSLLDTFQWVITVDFGKRIFITFLELLLDSATSGECSSGIEIYDGSDENAPSLATECGSQIPDPIQSSSNQVFIKTNLFSGGNTEVHFKLAWLQIDIDVPALDQQTINTTCGSTDVIDLNALSNYTVMIQSPGYPYGYKNNIICEWIFTTIAMNHLRIIFKDLDLHGYVSYIADCYQDFVEIHQRDEHSDWESLSKICKPNATGSDNQLITKNFMKVIFYSNYAVNGTGFSALVKEDCGGTLTDPNGVIIYDNNTRARYDSTVMKTCQWNVTVRTGRKISVEVELKIFQGNSGRPCSSYLILRNGISESSPLLGTGKYCEQTSVKLTTTGNQLYVKYYGYFNYANFKITYSEVSNDCNRDITLSQYTKSAIIYSPNYPNVPPPHIECIWKIMATPGEVLRIDFEITFDLFPSEECTKEYVEIRDGGGEFSRLIGRFCHNTPNSQFTSDNMMFVKFFTDVAEPGNGFLANISIANCGGTYHSGTGQITSPFFNNKLKYPPDTRCTWHLVTSPHKNFMIEFEKVDLRTKITGGGCDETDSVAIFDGLPNEANATPVLRVCEKNSNTTTFTSSTNHVLITFTSDKHRQELKGFSLKYNSTTKICRQEIEQPQGIIQYPTRENSGPTGPFNPCVWIIKVPNGRRVTVEVLVLNVDILDNTLPWVYHRGLSFSNSEDRQTIFKEISSASPGKIVKSSDNILYMYYWNDGNVNEFKVKFSSDEPTICQGDLNADSGEITQPLEPISSYSCIYVRSNTKAREPVTVALDIQASSNSSKEKYICTSQNSPIAVTTIDNKRIAIECTKQKSINTVLRIPHNNFKLKTTQTNRIVFNYTISYTVHNCGGVVSAETGNIVSPGYPNPDSNTDCAWLIKLPKEQSISLTIEEMDLGDDCEQSFLDIFNGDSSASPKIGRFCNNRKPETISSQREYLLIEYKFRKGTKGKGFKAKYEPIISGCGGIYHDQDLVIQTPSYPNPYPNNAECLWELRADVGFHIGFKVVAKFSLETSPDCKNDFVEVFDWKNSTWSSFGRYCGRDIGTFNSTANRMKVLFRSNDRISSSGFRARWDWNCGGTFIADRTERFIVSPGYPGKYPRNAHCVYQLTVPAGIENINIEFYEFNIEGENSVNCKYDNVTVTNSFGSTTPSYSYQPVLTQVYCGTNLPPRIRYQSPLFIIFQSDAYWQLSAGFKFSYQLDDCGGEIDQPQMIKSPVFKKLKTHDLSQQHKTCTWNITAPEGKIIVVQFEKFKFKYRGYCYYDGVEVFRGKAGTGYDQRLASLCGDLSRDPPVIKVDNNTASLVLRTDNELEDSGFEAAIYFRDGPKKGCGGNLNLADTEQELNSPNLLDMDCFWTITAPVDRVIQLSFEHIHFPSTCEFARNSTKACPCGFIEIRDGDSTYSELIERICTSSTTITTTANVASLRLVTLGRNPNAFSVKIQAILTVCGPLYLNATNDIQTFQSPNYPNRYPTNLKCTWIIKGEKRFVIHFVDFDLNGGNSGNSSKNTCHGDMLKIIDDPSFHVINEQLGPNVVISGNRRDTSEFITYQALQGVHQFCGASQQIFDYYSESNSLTLTFAGGNFENEAGKGFKFEYHLIGCNRNFTGRQGRIVDNNNRPGGCVMTITVPENYTISLYYVTFTLYQGSEECVDIGIEIHDGEDANAPLLQKVCGYNLPNPVFSSKNKIFIKSWSPEYNIYSLWDMIYTSTDQGRGCGGDIYNYKGRFSSPLYPLSYRNPKQCTWNIKVPIGLRVGLKFMTYEIEGNCEENYVQVITYNEDEANTHTFCRQDIPAELYSDRRIQVIYQSSLLNNGTGFIAMFTAL